MTRAPRATYRVQLAKSFPLDSVAAIVPYLASLGISHVYLSPLFRARSGSQHGYDVVDPNEVSPDLGGIDALRRLADTARAAGLGLILDVVPNHMAASPENRWFADVLEGGRESPFARFFDVDWDARAATTGGRIVLPLLDEPLDVAIARGRFAVILEDAGLVVATPCGTLPLAPSTWDAVFAPGRVRFGAALGSGAAELHELERFLASAAKLRADVTTNAFGDLEALHVARRRVVAAFRAALGRWPLLATFITERLAAVNSEPERPRLAALLDAQRWRLACWKDAKGTRNFRRYADIDDLIAVDVDDEHVFRATHALALGLVADGVVAGLRVDHVDGLADPVGYFARLARGVRLEAGSRAWIAAEHFVRPGAAPPAEFGVPATTGYDFLAAITRFQSHAPGVARLAGIAAESGVTPIDAVAARREMLDTLLFDERDRLVDRLAALATESPAAGELPRPALDRAVVALTARLHGGRTFVRPGQ